MPELPEVESYRRYFARYALQRPIRAVTVQDRGVLASGTTTGSLKKALEGRQFEEVMRHGKNLFVRISEDGWLRIHFGMTGDLARFKTDPPRFGRVLFHFDDGGLAYEDPRKFGRVELIKDPVAYLEKRGIGPDPLSEDFVVSDFARGIGKRRGAIKPLLLNQRILAGVGNLYADEALFQSGIHPRARVETLSSKRLARLFQILGKVLNAVIEAQSRNGPYPRRFLLPRRDRGQRCPQCGGAIRRETVGGRTTYFCSKHQRISRATG